MSDVLSWIADQKKKGFSDNMLKDSLRKAGWREEDINGFFPEKTDVSEKKPSEIKPFDLYSVLLYIMVVLFAVFAGAGIFISVKVNLTFLIVVSLLVCAFVFGLFMKRKNMVTLSLFGAWVIVLCLLPLLQSLYGFSDFIYYISTGIGFFLLGLLSSYMFSHDNSDFSSFFRAPVMMSIGISTFYALNVGLSLLIKNSSVKAVEGSIIFESIANQYAGFAIAIISFFLSVLIMVFRREDRKFSRVVFFLFPIVIFALFVILINIFFNTIL
ncbi:MAG: hypothetical protein ACLFPQ_04875 [Candidatus Woesearchaeota archaeon]